MQNFRQKQWQQLNHKFHDPGLMLSHMKSTPHKPQSYRNNLQNFKGLINKAIKNKRIQSSTTIGSKNLFSVTEFKTHCTQSKRKDHVIFQFYALSEKSINLSLSLFSALNQKLALVIDHCAKQAKQSNVIEQKFINRHSQALVKTLLQNNPVKHHCLKAKSCQRFTVIRSPFVFKKSREQFGLFRFTCKLAMRMTKPQAHLLAQHMAATKFPAELKLNFKI